MADTSAPEDAPVPVAPVPDAPKAKVRKGDGKRGTGKRRPPAGAVSNDSATSLTSLPGSDASIAPEAAQPGPSEQAGPTARSSGTLPSRSSSKSASDIVRSQTMPRKPSGLHIEVPKDSGRASSTPGLHALQSDVRGGPLDVSRRPQNAQRPEHPLGSSVTPLAIPFDHLFDYLERLPGGGSQRQRLPWREPPITKPQLPVNAHCMAPVIHVAFNQSRDLALITLTCNSRGACIYYTLNGCEPNKNSFKYNVRGPFLLRHTARIRARAYLARTVASDMVETDVLVGEH